MNEKRPQILFLAHRVPYPPNRGDRIRSFHLIKFLAERADVHLAFLTEDPVPEETREVLEGLCARVTYVRLPRRGRWLSGAGALLAGRPATEGLFHSRRLQQEISSWTNEVRFDAVMVFCSSMVQYLRAPGLAGAAVVVDLVDVDSQKWFDYAATSRGLKRFLFDLEGQRLRRLECSLPGRAQAITLVSQAEANLYRGFCPTDQAHAMPNGVDLEYFSPSESFGAEQPQRCVFVGALDYRANIDGIRWFCQEVWPLVRRRRPGARFAIVGSNPAPRATRARAIVATVRTTGS